MKKILLSNNFVCSILTSVSLLFLQTIFTASICFLFSYTATGFKKRKKIGYFSVKLFKSVNKVCVLSLITFFNLPFVIWLGKVIQLSFIETIRWKICFFFFVSKFTMKFVRQNIKNRKECIRKNRFTEEKESKFLFWRLWLVSVWATFID